MVVFRWVFAIVLFSATLFVSAVLLFLIEPMFARFVLPSFGGTPAVWTGSMMFFQAALLASYLYVHATTTWLGARKQAVVHLVVVALPILLFLFAGPLSVPVGEGAPSTDGDPLFSLIVLLFASIGLPFFAVSATNPLIQRWLAGTDHPAAKDPYFLYVASNLGGVMGLLGYPLLEANLRLGEQGIFWSVGYVLLVALVFASAAVLWLSPPATDAPAATEGDEAASPSDLPAERGGASETGAPLAEPVGTTSAPTLLRRLRWIGLTFVPSSLMLGVTAFMTTDITPIPLLWAVPLSLYLLSLAIVFARGWRPLDLILDLVHVVMVGALPLVITLLAVTMLTDLRSPFWLLILLHLLGFFVVTMVLHGELALDRPPARRLTEFYLWVAVGGALGGVFNALVAPAAFDAVWEYPLVILLACLLWSGVVARLLVQLVAWLSRQDEEQGSWDEERRRDPQWRRLGPILNLGLGAVVLFIAVFYFATVATTNGATALYEDRSFFGVYRVTEATKDPAYHALVSGNTNHGAQVLGQTPPVPITYYERTGPVGQLFDALPDEIVDESPVAVLGLGAGVMSCYAETGQRWTFYEIDPLVERIARDPNLFTYLRDCPGEYDVVLGDARLGIADAEDGEYGMIAASAFSSDAIPMHLMTREAVDLYLQKLREDGVLVMHISNRRLELEPVVGNLAQDRELVCYAQFDNETRDIPYKLASHFTVLARDEDDLGGVPDDPRWQPCATNPSSTVWTDDYSNLLSALDLN